MNQLFKYGENEVRTVMIEGEPWFVLSDVCKTLGLRAPDVRQRLSDDVVSTHSIIDSRGRANNASIVSEDGLYDVLLDSRKPEAKQFRKWVTSEVLPAIRKHGGYLTPEKIEEALLNPDTLIQLATQLKTERAEKERLRLETERQAAVISEQAPKVDYHDQILASEGTLLVTQIAKDYCLTAVELNLVLKAEGVQYKRGNQWVLKADYSKLGYTDSLTYLIGEAHSTVNTKWTQTGRIFIHRLLERVGIRAGMGPDAAGQMYLAEIKQREQEARKKKKSA